MAQDGKGLSFCQLLKSERVPQPLGFHTFSGLLGRDTAMDDSTGCRRALPDRWQVPEWMAAGTLDLPKWEAGQRLMRPAAPDAFANIEAGDRIITANRVVKEACRKQ